MTLLLLAGTNEAKRIVNVLAERGVDVVASLAGATRQPTALPVPTRIGGFGGEVGFRAYLETHNITAVLDATHPFAHRITDRTARICRGMSLPYAAVVRPEWAVQNSEKWTSISEPQEAACHISVSAIVFLATGRQTLAQFANLGGRRVLARVIDPPMAPFPFVGGEFVVGRPPFTQSQEETLFTSLGVTHLVVKNAGGDGGRAKLDAARVLSIRVLMMQRPPIPDATQLKSVQDALDWVAAL